MSLSHSLSIATSGLTANARLAATVSSNLANALTEGYARRSLTLSAQVIGGGVTVEGIQRHSDRAVIGDRRGAAADMAGQSLMAKALAAVEGAWSGTGAGDGIAARLAALDAALAQAAGDPASDLALAGAVTALSALGAEINAAARTIQTQRGEAENQIAADVATLNTTLRALEDSNAAIAKATYAGREVAGLLDARQQLVDRIASIVPVHELDRPGGQIALVTTAGEVLIDGRARQYGFSAAALVTDGMTLADGSLAGLTRDGQPLAGGFGLLGGGTLAAGFALRDDILPAQSAALDAFAYDLMQRFAAADASLPAGQTALLGDGGAGLPLSDLTGVAARLRLHAALDPAQGGDIRRLRDGFGGGLADVGDGRQLAAWRAALGGDSQLASGGPQGDAASHAARLTGQIGQIRLWADTRQVQAAARWSALRESELAMGVDSDAEMQMLLRIEQAFAANARVITAIDDMFSQLLRI